MIKNETISSESLVVQGKENIVSNMGGEKVMLSIRNGKYYNLGEIGGKIWDSIQRPISVAELVSDLTSEFDVDKSVCQDHVISFLEHLSEEGLIDIEKVNR